MVPAHELVLFAGAALLMVLTPGPNMIYLLSRSLAQGRIAGVISLLGIVSAFFVHMLATALGLSAFLFAVPVAYELLRFLGAGYLLWLAFQAVRPGARSPFETRALPFDAPAKLFFTGFLTNLLNPKIAVFYLSIFPQFVDPTRGSVLVQSFQLGTVQIAVSSTVNLAIVFSAAWLASWFSRNPRWISAQRYFMGLVLTGLAVRLVLDPRAKP